MDNAIVTSVTVPEMSPLAKADAAALPGPMARSPNWVNGKKKATIAATRTPDTAMRFPPRTSQCIARSTGPSMLRTELAVLTSSLMADGNGRYRRYRWSKHAFVPTSRCGVKDMSPSTDSQVETTDPNYGLPAHTPQLDRGSDDETCVTEGHGSGGNDSHDSDTSGSRGSPPRYDGSGTVLPYNRPRMAE
ncbi:hypothetical protein GCM10009000_022520 [Halobacterium noricense]